MPILRLINGWLKHFAYETQSLFFFSMKMVRGMIGRPLYLLETREQMYLVGIGSLYLVVLTGIFAGQGFALAFSVELADFGAKNYLGRIMAIAIVRELGPVLTGLMIAARVAAGITAEIGAMKSSNQIDAMTSFGIDPIRKLAVQAVELIANQDNLTELLESTREKNHSGEVGQRLQQSLPTLCAHYLLKVKRGRQVDDRVAHFHLTNGAQIKQINWAANLSDKGIEQSFGMMVNYLYDLPSIEKHHEAYRSSGAISASSAVKKLAR